MQGTRTLVRGKGIKLTAPLVGEHRLIYRFLNSFQYLISKCFNNGINKGT